LLKGSRLEYKIKYQGRISNHKNLIINPSDPMKLNPQPRYPLLTAGAILLVSALSTQADIITIPNFSFESPALAPGGFSYTVDNFTGGGPAAGSTGVSAGTAAYLGSQYAFIQTDSAGDKESLTTTNAVATSVLGTTYTLSVYVAGRTDGFGIGGIGTLSLLDNGSVVDSASSSAVRGFTASNYKQIDFSYTSLTAGDALTLQMSVVNPNDTYGHLQFDDLNLTAEAVAVPEPATYALICTGLVGLFAIYRFRSLNNI
jgi:hypothetical protein